MYRYDESNQSASAPDVWSFFEQETGGRARCVVCRATLPHRAKELKHHLKENHPKLAQDFDDESENEEDQSNDTYTEVVYLEDDTRKTPKRDAQVIMKRRHSVKTPHPTPILKKVKRRKSSSSDDYPLRNKKINNQDDDDDQIEKFGTYITCLLKKMPKDVCTKLQMDIINLIMTAKLKLPSETPVENKVILEGVPVAIQTVNAVPGTGYIVTVPTSSSEVNKETVTVTNCEVKNDPLTQDNRDMPKITVTSPVTQDVTVNNC
ncbi:unnamed protein product [Parnassius apollo]|uniref:(apollo) hypothetical protein n=1 Tax=Parnassius apollo TaxID=110799 RepID=A0A8S3W2A4_PARAO|nr:unnamed protein product [Parnassius apollo]